MMDTAAVALGSMRGLPGVHCRQIDDRMLLEGHLRQKIQQGFNG
jgi:hypothetical protein